MTYAQAKKVKIQDALKPKIYNWEFHSHSSIFRCRKGIVSEIEHDEVNKKIVFVFIDGRKFEHTEILKKVEP